MGGLAGIPGAFAYDVLGKLGGNGALALIALQSKPNQLDTRSGSC